MTTAARALAYGGLTLVDPNRVRGWAKGAYWAALSGTAAAETVATPEVDRSESIPWGVAAGSRGPAEKSDAWTVRVLRGWGLRRPRVWLAGASVAAVVAASWLERRFIADEGMDAPWPAEMGPAEPLPENVRAIIAALLDAVDGYDAEHLRAQLATAQGGEVGDPQAIGLAVGEHAPTDLLDSFLWPVTATFERAGVTREVVLEIAEGRLWRLSQWVRDEAIDLDAHDWSWPTPEALTITPGVRFD